MIHSRRFQLTCTFIMKSPCPFPISPLLPPALFFGGTKFGALLSAISVKILNKKMNRPFQGAAITLIYLPTSLLTRLGSFSLPLSTILLLSYGWSCFLSSLNKGGLGRQGHVGTFHPALCSASSCVFWGVYCLPELRFLISVITHAVDIFTNNFSIF